ncbi:HD domain-containing phosphohydrolase [Elusimicrobiota bacterium]
MAETPAGKTDSRADRLKRSMEKLTSIAVSLSQEHDLDRMLEMILTLAREVVGCDAGNLYLVRKVEGIAPSRTDFLTDKELFFKAAQNDSVNVPFHETALEITSAEVTGFCARTGEPLNVTNVRRLPASAPHRIDGSFDEATGYKTLSMLLVPMKNHRGELLGVLQLINRRSRPERPLGKDFPEGEVLPFDQDSVDVTVAMAGQAAVAIGNHNLRESLRKLHRIGVALTQEHDLDRLLDMILTYTRQLTDCDAGSLYLVQKRPGAGESKTDFLADKELFFKLTQNDSVHVPFRESSLEITPRSVAGYATLEGEPLNLPDVADIPPSAPYTVDRTFDDATGYRTISMLTVPMKNHRGELLGLLQLINRRKSPACPLGLDYGPEEVLPFDLDSEKQAMSLAGQAAVGIENSRLYAEIRALFDAFVSASVSAIEARDPTTSGHSERVASYMSALAEVVDRTTTGPYAEVHFSTEDLRQLRYASLLHDFGKIGVREAVLVKAKKLHPHELTTIEQRVSVVALHMKLRAAQEKLDALSSGAKAEAGFPEIEAALMQALKLLEDDIEQIRKANNPSALEDDSFAHIQELAKRKLELPDSDLLTLINEDEARRLGIRRGSLSEEERKEIESHVSQTFTYLEGIPWPRLLRRVPEIAHSHHEKLNGRGYPRGLKAEDLSVESRMMAICDIYDALTAWDRPYKKAMPVERALDVIRDEVKRGALDEELTRLFLDEKVYEAVKPPAG